MTRPQIICLTPVKNEAWILSRFLECASTWADHIIVADQGSTDGSREIARKFPKVILLDNETKTFNEPERQALLIRAARQIPGPRLLIALDADEILTGNLTSSPEWNTMLGAQPGTVVWFEMSYLISDERYFMWNAPFALGFVDDGSEHKGIEIHSSRLPQPPGAPALFLKQIKVMHYAPVDADRESRKRQWYQCWETVNYGKRSPVELYRMYHKVQCFSPEDVHRVQREWMHSYEQAGIDMTSVQRPGRFWWDKEIVDMLATHGAKRFRRLDIWNVNWPIMQEEIYPDGNTADLSDPRSMLDKFIMRWLSKTQHDFNIHARPRRLRKMYYRFMHRVLGLFGW